jgi:hypothetical protein
METGHKFVLWWKQEPGTGLLGRCSTRCPTKIKRGDIKSENEIFTKNYPPHAHLKGVERCRKV